MENIDYNHESVEYSQELHLEQLIELSHPSIGNVLKYFRYKHLPAHLRGISSRFAGLAIACIDYEKLTVTEATVGLRKLLEAKDCFVRAALDRPATDNNQMRDDE